MRPDHLGLLHTPAGPSAHPDGTWAVLAISRPDVTEDAYPSQLWRINLADGALRPLTHGFCDTEPRISPDGRYIAFLRAAKGGKAQLALLPTDGGEPQVLTDHDLGVATRPEFSPDATRIAYTARVPEPGRYGTTEGVGAEAEPPRHITTFTYRLDGPGFFTDRHQHVFVIDVPPVADGAEQPWHKEPTSTADDDASSSSPGALAGAGVTPVQISTQDREHRSPVWTPDGQRVLVIGTVADALRTELLALPAGGSGQVEVLAAPNSAPDAVTFGADGTSWLLARDLGADDMDFIGKTSALYRGGYADGRLTDLQQVTDPTVESLTSAVFEAGAQGVLISRMHRGDVDLVRYGAEGLQPVHSGSVSVTGATVLPGGGVLVTAGSVDSAGDLWLLAGDGDARRLTDLSGPLRAEAGLSEPRELEIDAEDGYPVHGWVTVPEGPGPHPVLLLIHGGPYGQYQPVLFDEVQIYTKAGYAVVFCNPRGSAGYGQAHGRAITGAFGDRDAADVLAFLDGALAAHPQLDAQRVGVLGGSYGGYLTAWLTTRTDRFTAAIVERGFLDPVSFEGSSDIGWYFGLRYLGEDPGQVAAQSPMAHIEQVNTPTLVIHSEHDWRCPVEQGQRWFVGLKRRGVEAELLLFPGEGHELSRSGRPQHRQARFEHILTWWERHLPTAAR